MGGVKYSLDEYFLREKEPFTQKKYFSLLGSGVLNLKEKTISISVLVGSILIFGLTLFTNQVFHGGVWGTLHSKSVRPNLVITDAKFAYSQLKCMLDRVEGADVYGSFLIVVQLLNENGEIVF